MATKRGIAVASARAVGGVIAVGAFAAVVAGAALLPLPTVSVAIPAEIVTPTPFPQSRVCPGPILQLSDGSGSDATSASAIGQSTVVSGALSGAAAPDSTPLRAIDSSSDGEGLAPVELSAQDPAVTIGGAQSQTAATTDLSGLATALCAEPTADAWLVGGATTVGRTSFVLLSNPSDVTAVVALSIYAEGGTVNAPGVNAIEVPSKSQKVLPLAGLAPEVVSPVVHVVSTGGTVVASIQQSVIRGLEPGGVELIGAAEGPGSQHTITGVQIIGTSTIAQRISGAGYADLQSALRVFVPGSNDASVTVTMTNEVAGSQAPRFTTTAAAGKSTELAISDVPDGTYSISIESTEPLVAAARTSVIDSGKLDFAWYTPESPLTEPFVLPVAAGPAPRLHTFNAGSVEVTLTLTPSSGQPIELTVPAGAAVGVALTPGETYSAQPSGPLAVSVGYSGGGQLSAYGVTAPSPLASDLTIFP